MLHELSTYKINPSVAILNASNALVQGLVMSYIDNGNSLFVGILGEPLNKLQGVQNMAARMVFRLKNRSCESQKTSLVVSSRATSLQNCS